MLTIRNLRCGYGTLEVLKGISLHVVPGEIVGLLGANGAGKTTLLHAITGLIAPWDGHVLVNRTPVRGTPVWRGVSRSLTLVPEGRQLFRDMSVLENLVVGGYHNPDRQDAIEEVLDRFPRLRERSQQAAGTLSGGEQQMLALGRALVARPRLLLLDEPSMGLAPLLVKEVFSVIRELKHHGVTIFLVEQNAVATLDIADRAYVLETGDIILEGQPEELFQNPEVKRAYLGKGYKEVWE